MKKDEYIVITRGDYGELEAIKKGYCFKQRETHKYLRPYKDLNGSTTNGWGYITDNSKFWRLATCEEIDAYDANGGPYKAILDDGVYLHTNGAIVEFINNNPNYFIGNRLKGSGGIFIGNERCEWGLHDLSPAPKEDLKWFNACKDAGKIIQRSTTPKNVFFKYSECITKEMYDAFVAKLEGEGRKFTSEDKASMEIPVQPRSHLLIYKILN